MQGIVGRERIQVVGVGQHHTERFAASHQRHRGDAIQAARHDFRQFDVLARRPNGALPVVFDVSGHTGRLDKSSVARSSVEQDDGRRTTARDDSQLGTQQAKLGALVALGVDATTEIDERAESAIVVAEDDEVVAEQAGHELAGV